MTFDPTVGWAVIATVALAAVAAVGWLFTLHSGHGSLREAVKVQGAQLDSARGRVEALELTVAERCVKKDDLERVEDRLAARIVTVEETVRTSAIQIISALSGRSAGKV